ncbi:hypothetical protein RvVAT039_38640 [Agrobacterium vitis]|nr:hypothetical protein RvVAT039_38640 [Agrobacterium vitis]
MASGANFGWIMGQAYISRSVIGRDDTAIVGVGNFRLVNFRLDGLIRRSPRRLIIL